MEQQGRLTILVKSDQYFDFVDKLAQAAFQKKRTVKIHMMGAGVALLWADPFARLIEVAQVSICRDSFDQFRGKKWPTIPESVTVVPPQKISEIIQWGDRSVVF